MNIEKTLLSYGLSERQAKIYLACLELGAGSVQRIAQRAGLARSTVYEVLDSLAQKGFVHSYKKRKVQCFSAAEPEKIVSLAEERAATLKQALPALNALLGQARYRPAVRFYEGKSGMKQILDEILSEAAEICTFGSVEDLFSQLGQEHKHFIEQRLRKRITVRAILQESALARERQSLGEKQLRDVKIIPHLYDYRGMIYLWKNKIAMFSLVQGFVAVVVESPELAATLQALFDHLWQKS